LRATAARQAIATQQLFFERGLPITIPGDYSTPHLKKHAKSDKMDFLFKEKTLSELTAGR